MPAQNGNKLPAGSVNKRLEELGIMLPAAPKPLGSYVESVGVGNLLFLTGALPVANGKLAISGRLGESLSVAEGQEAARIASLNVLAIAKEHLGTLDPLRRLIKLTVLMRTTESFADLPKVADGASNFFEQIFGKEAGHARLVYGVLNLPIGAPVIVDTIFEIEPADK